jgi:arginine-tRNA-protein transferase
MLSMNVVLTHALSREKKTQRDIFDLKTSVHKSEYSNLKRPINPKTKKQIEPAHKFEVTVEPDNFTEEK